MKYQLPAGMGGGVVEAASDDPDYWKIGFDLYGCTDRVWLRRGDVTLMVEPNNAESVVRAALQDGRYDDGSVEQAAHVVAALTAAGLPPLMPARRYEVPVPLPHSVTDVDGDDVLVVNQTGGENVALVPHHSARSRITPDAARLLARALWTAAGRTS